ncbi:MAG: LamG domain-containing protein, partial [Clostridia bacterium]
GSTLPGTGTNWYTTELTEILNEYPQAVTFGGHVHHPLNDERSIMQTKFTSLGCGSVSYMAIESGYIQTGVTTVPNDCQKYSQGIVAQVDEKNNVRFTRMDFYNNSTIKEAWVISSPSAKNHLKEYTPERADKNEAPSFGVNPEFAFTSDISGYKCNLNVSFPAASDDDMVHHYEIEVSIDGKVFKTYKLLSGFYLVPTTDKMAKKLVANLEALPTAKKAEINICAIDSWGAKSTPITYSLTTPGNPEISVPDADTKSKIYASIEFSADGKYTDKFSKLLLTNVGADISVQKFTFGGKECKLPSLNIDAAGESMKAEFKDFTTPKEASEFFSNGFSIEALYVNRAPAATQGILCGTQNGGWGLAESNGTPYFIVSTGGYQSVYASNAADHSALTHVVAVFDTKRNEIRIYINGNVSESVSLSGALKLGEGNTFNGFYIGADISKNGSGGDFKMSDFSIVTANIYSGAVSSDEVEKIYANLLK